MTDDTTRRTAMDSVDGASSAAVGDVPGQTPALGATDAYEVEDGVVLFDVDNPLAWVEADDAVALSDVA
jgi:hypothetical protein